VVVALSHSLGVYIVLTQNLAVAMWIRQPIHYEIVVFFSFQPCIAAGLATLHERVGIKNRLGGGKLGDRCTCSEFHELA
jgi:hypothetical protein